VAMVFADNEERRLDDEPEIAMFKRAPVALTHQEADQTGIAFRQLIRGLVERDASPVHNCEIRGEGSVEGNKPMIENGDDVVG